MDTDYQAFVKQVAKTINVDLSFYKEQQMKRRILQWITRNNLVNFSGLIEALKKDAALRTAFRDYLTINTSQFFRDVKVFKAIEEVVLPAISERVSPSIWSAGCSIGAEVYSIAMLLAEKKVKARRLLASDIDENAMDIARKGEYPAEQVAGVPKRLLQSYFDKRENRYFVKEEIKKMVRFSTKNLLKDTFETGFHLILCRNVFIYFTQETQNGMVRRFVDSLKPGGYFIVGSSEHVMNPDQFGLKRVSFCIYSKEERG